MGDLREGFGWLLVHLLEMQNDSFWREVCGGVSHAVSNACVLCNCGIERTKGEEGLLITNGNVSYCVSTDPKR